MPAADEAALRSQAHWKAAVELRLADDRSKVPGRAVPSRPRLPVLGAGYLGPLRPTTC
ncbi:MAG: hypothetical protein ACRDZ8_19720 [Acidimicrobiales bacterium]